MANAIRRIDIAQESVFKAKNFDAFGARRHAAQCVALIDDQRKSMFGRPMKAW